MAKSKYIEALEEQYTKKDAKSVLRYKAPDNKWRYIQTSKDASGGDTPTPMPSGGMEEVTWQELKDKRDAGKLTPGSLYRITDYNCTTTQENTRSAGHQFDIVLLALSENKLAEEGWAMMHENIYDVTFKDGVTKKCYLYYTGEEDAEYNIVDVTTLMGTGYTPAVMLTINEETKTVIYAENSYILSEEDVTYNYFQNSNLSAWKVWYCLDNDKSRFAWADNGHEAQVVNSNVDIYGTLVTSTRSPENDTQNQDTTYYAWGRIDPGGSEEIYYWYTASETPNVGDALYDIYDETEKGIYQMDVVGEYISAGEGTGVIYRLIDEWNIDYPCDFKNMQMLTPMDSDGNIDLQNPVTSKYCYAFTDNTSGEPEDLSIKGHTVNIKVKAKLIEETHSAMYFSPGTLFYTNRNESNSCRFSDITVGIAGVTAFINIGYAINILDGCGNVMLQSCRNICIGYNSSNIMLDTVVNSTFGSNCQNIQLSNESNLNYGNNGVELATKDDLT